MHGVALPLCERTGAKKHGKRNRARDLASGLIERSKTASAPSAFGRQTQPLSPSTFLSLSPTNPNPTQTPSGFPPALVDLKERIERAHPCLPRESPGSKWPKTTLAALKDGQRLTPQQLEVLSELCRQESAAFHYEGDRASLAVTHASVVVFACRSLERVVAARDVALDCSMPEDDSPPDAAAEAAAAKVMAEPDAPGYWVQAAADGNRESHYRGDHVGVTLVFRHRRRDLGLASEAAAKAAKRLAEEGNDKKKNPEKHPEPHEGEIGLARLGAICDDFQGRVEAALPGMYAWFEPGSRHVTLRGICG